MAPDRIVLEIICYYRLKYRKKSTPAGGEACVPRKPRRTRTTSEQFASPLVRQPLSQCRPSLWRKKIIQLLTMV